jgi:hypothetical protein
MVQDHEPHCGALQQPHPPACGPRVRVRRPDRQVPVPPQGGCEFNPFAAQVLHSTANVILLVTTFWGGNRPCVRAAGVCEAFQLGWRRTTRGSSATSPARGLTSGLFCRTCPSPRTRTLPPGRRRHRGGMVRYEDRTIRVPECPGLGLTLDPERVDRYSTDHRQVGGLHLRAGLATSRLLPVHPQTSDGWTSLWKAQR